MTGRTHRLGRVSSPLTSKLQVTYNSSSSGTVM